MGMTRSGAPACSTTAGAGAGTPSTGAAGTCCMLSGCAAGRGSRTLRIRVATEASPSSSPAAAARKIAQRERTRPGANDAGARTLATTGISLGGGIEETRGGADWTRGVGALRRDSGAACATTGGASITGGGGGTLARATGMCSDSGASPIRTTTACCGGRLSPGRAIKPPRGVAASGDTTSSESRGSEGGAGHSGGRIGPECSSLPRLASTGQEGGRSAHHWRPKRTLSCTYTTIFLPSCSSVRSWVAPSGPRSLSGMSPSEAITGFLQSVKVTRICA